MRDVLQLLGKELVEKVSTPHARPPPKPQDPYATDPPPPPPPDLGCGGSTDNLNLAGRATKKRQHPDPCTDPPAAEVRPSRAAEQLPDGWSSVRTDAIPWSSINLPTLLVLWFQSTSSAAGSPCWTNNHTGQLSWERPTEAAPTKLPRTKQKPGMSRIPW